MHSLAATLPLQLIKSSGISWVLVHVDHPRSGSVACPQGFAEEPFGSWGISGLTEQELQGIAGSVHGSVQVHPLPFDLDLCLIRPPGVVGHLQVGPAALL